MLEQVEWGEFKLGDPNFFEIGTGSLVDIKSATEGKIPRVSVQTTDNGILGYYDETLGNARYFENFISINFFGIAYYHPYRASVEMKVHTLKLVNHELTKGEGLFIAAMLNKRFNGQYSYGSQLSSSKLKNEDFRINLPIKNGNIDFEFINKFIAELEAEHQAELEAEHQAELEAYLETTGLKDYELTNDELKVLKELEEGKVEWKNFRIEEVLNRMPQKEIDPLKIPDLSVEGDKRYPFYGQSTLDNGVISYEHLKDSVLNNSNALPTILIHSNNQNVVYLETPFYLKDGHGATSVLQKENLNKLNAMFLMATISKIITQKFSYQTKATKIALKNTVIELPVKDGNINYAFMERYIIAVQKLIIKDLVKYADREIEATKEVINKN